MYGSPVTPPSPAPSPPSSTTEPAALASDLREAMRPLWRQFNTHRTVSLVRLGTLARLARSGPATAADLAAHQHVSPQAMTTVLKEFDDDGLVVRTPDAEDRRRVVNEITELGRQRLAVHLTEGNEWLEQAIADRLDQGERDQLASLLPLLAKLVGDLDD